MPTVALLNGHGFAGGFMVAMYVVLLCLFALNERMDGKEVDVY